MADKSSPGFPLLLEPLGRILGASMSPDAIQTLLTQVLEPDRVQDFSWQSAFLLGILDNSQMRDVDTIGDLMAQMILPSTRVALDEKRDETDRIRALEVLTLADTPESLPVLQSALESKQPLALRTAAAKALAGNPDPEVIRSLMESERWRGFPPAVRSMVISVLLAKGIHLEILLLAIEKGDVETWAVDAARREQIKNHPNETVRMLASQVFEGQAEVSREKVYEEYRSVLELTADASRGREVFFNQCTQCHRLEGRGFETGPDLFGIKTQTAETILLHILAPNREIAPAYVNYAVETTEGEIMTGILASETANSVTLRRAQGEEDTLLRGEIASIRSTNLSLMPDELEKGMSRQDLADLVFYLKGAAR